MRSHSNIPDNLEEIVESYTPPSVASAPLLAELEPSVSSGAIVVNDVAIRHDGITQNQTLFSPSAKVSPSQVGSSQVGSNQPRTEQTGSPQVSVSQIAPQFSIIQDGISQVSTSQYSTKQQSLSQVSTVQVSTTQVDEFQISSGQISTTKVNTTENILTWLEISNVTHTSNVQVDTTQVNPRKIPLSTGIAPIQLLSVHDSSPLSLYSINNSAQTFWNTLLSPSTPLDINLQLVDLPTGQLAEAQITSFDPFGHPNGGTLLIDEDANGLGWYIDPTPLDNSEFTTTLTNTAFRATPGSPAYGRYDLLTTLLHEIGHLAGFISGYSGYDRHIQTLNSSPLFISDNITATLTPDKSHLDPKLYPYDLMNPTLTPGVRKLPSLLDLQILNSIRSSGSGESGENLQLNAPLDSEPLIAILNGNFDSSNSTEPDYGWSTRGATAILNGQAILGEDKRLLSNFSQTFIVPQAAKYLQFTLLDTTLGTSPLDPPDAFEVALLDANTYTSLVGTIRDKLR